jgi:hypothetical protein
MSGFEAAALQVHRILGEGSGEHIAGGQPAREQLIGSPYWATPIFVPLLKMFSGKSKTELANISE